MLSSLCTYLLVTVLAGSVPCASEPWQDYIHAPDSRTPAPECIKRIQGRVEVHGLDVNISPGGQVTYDFGREVGGHVSFLIKSVHESPVSLSFTESPLFIGAWSDDTGASPYSDWDQSLNISLPSTASGSWYNYTMPTEKFRGGFRFFTVTASPDLDKPVSISKVHCLLGFHPGVSNPMEAYRGYFYTPDDDVLVRTWYAGAYTVQTNIAPQNTGRYLPQVRPGWAYNSTLGVASPILLDGAKRDRAVWPGDLGISGLSSYLAFGPSYGYECIRNALETLFYFQNPSTGMFPFAGPDTASFRAGSKSDTYHSWTLIAIADYAFYSADDDWINLHWNNITRAVDYILSGITEQGLQNQTWPNDWARQGSGGLNSALNAITYGVLTSFSNLAASRDSVLAESWSSTAKSLKSAFNALLWDPAAGLYRDNTTTSLHPQDGNSFALVFNLTASDEQKTKISNGLMKNWNSIGPVTPELQDTISLFISSWEVKGHFIANEPDRAIELIRRLWGFALDSKDMGGSTIVEGLSANGSLYYRSQAGYNYDPTYTSMAHSWSTGPTQSLITQLLGLHISAAAGKTWEFGPAFGAGGLKNVKGGFETALGMFEAEWNIVGEMAVLKMKAPKGTKGQLNIGRKWIWKPRNVEEVLEVEGNGEWQTIELHDGRAA